MDPLSVLREFSVAKQLDLVTLDDGRVTFGERYSFPKSVSTGYKRHGGGFYDLQTLVYLLQQPASYHWLNYVRLARESNIPQVAFADRKDLQDYLTGVTDRSDKIQLTAQELLLPLDATEGSEPSAKKARLDTSGAEAALETPPLLGKERQLRDRNSQLSVPTKSFKQVLELLHMAQREHATWNNAAKPKAPLQAPKDRRIPQMPSNRFNRPAEHNPGGTFKIKPPPAPPGAPPLPQITGGAPPLPPSSIAPPLAAKKQPQPLSSRQDSSAVRRKDSRQKLKPIIIVPAAASAKITMLNVRSFLEKGQYISNEAARKEGVKKESQLIVNRRLGRNTPVPYEVTDKAPPPRSHDWRRVVAVFVTGAAWQFKDWPHRGAAKGEMADTFHHVLGIHISMKNEQLNDTIKNWNVQRFRLHPYERHGDQPIVMEIFAAIDKFMSGKQRSGQSLEIAY